MKKRGICPICEQPTTQHGTDAFAPFCSQRCADLDLGRWLKGSYSIAVPASPDEAEGLPTQSGENPDETSEN